MKPFVEISRFDQDGSGSSFFQTGSSPSLGEDPGTFDQPLRNKEQVRLSFSVNLSIKMLGNSSSIYYLDTVNGRWGIPTRSIADHVGPFDKFAFYTYNSPPFGTTGQACTPGSKFPEDSKGFDARGRSIVSGSLAIRRSVITSSFINYANQSIGVLGRQSFSLVDGKKVPDLSDALEPMADSYPASINQSPLYEADRRETFTTGLTSPFMIEKIVVKLPISVGPGWFDDSTISTITYKSGTFAYNSAFIQTFNFDVGGPALSVSLYCQKNFGSSSIRELICSGTVSHDRDALSQSIMMRYIPDNFISAGDWLGTPHYVIDQIGNRGRTTSYIERTSSGFFTGSVDIPMTAAVSNGSRGTIYRGFYIYKPTAVGLIPSFQFTPETFLSKVWEILGNKYEDGDSQGLSEVWTLTGISPYGRGMTGFYSTGGSLFGGTFSSPQSSAGINKIRNPSYDSDSRDSKQASYDSISGTLASLVNSYGGVFPASDPIAVVRWSADFDFVSTKQSPYIVNPQDKLILAISKTRPALSGCGYNVKTAADADVGAGDAYQICYVTGSTSASHDVTLMSGNIDLTLYGSYVQAGRRHGSVVKPASFNRSLNIKNINIKMGGIKI